MTAIKALLIDDDPVLRLVLKHQLTALGLDVTECDSAVAAAQDHNPADFDIVLCDQQMPEMSGLELLQRWKDVAETPFVLVTGFLEKDELPESVELATAYLSKPVSSKKLAEVVGSLSLTQLY